MFCSAVIVALLVSFTRLSDNRPPALRHGASITKLVDSVGGLAADADALRPFLALFNSLERTACAAAWL